ncbi:MAG: UDP-N-acetylmuramoyl-L-alanine--D-glutamate ligase [Clostridia bacterium]|nr:UDP-N-acetylmuramoyl-L-alanine--D-glutamate ligase [Clostridia bacterium]
MIYSMLNEGCSVGFYGLGMTNSALLCCLPLQNCNITLRSDGKINGEEIPKGIRVDRILCSENAREHLDEDIIFFSPSVRRDRKELKEARARGVIFTSDAELFFERNKRPIYAITGSDGKSTTATLVHLLLTKAGYKAPLIGNVGEPMMPYLTADADCYVCELSSFMLQYLSPSVRSACITNITPNHLNWHKSFEEYKSTKLSLLKGAEMTVVGEDFTLGGGIISDRLDFDELLLKRSAKTYYTVENGYICRNRRHLIPISQIKRQEAHNIRNLMMAIAMTDGTVSREAMMSVARNFGGLAHRCELFLSKDGVDFIDSSIDSTPARTAQTLFSLNRRAVVILGGRGKGLDYGELVPALKKYTEEAIICGENADEIYRCVSTHVKAKVVNNMDEAVNVGYAVAKNVGVLMLSPASTSYDRYKNYVERGEHFKEICHKISEYENISLQNIEETRKKSETDLS